MPIVNRFADLHVDIAAWRRDIHANPELGYDVQRTARLVAEKLTEFGVDELATGIGKTGVVGVIRGRQTRSGRVIGLRADMDALPILEATGLPYASKVPGRMHACGHDGHTAMLLGAAKYLCETRNFNGTAVVIFQPAEEGGYGARAMVDDGMMERFGIQEVYGMHNVPGVPVGEFAIRPGAFLAAGDGFTIDIEGRGGHAAYPHNCVDTTLIGAQMVVALQSIVSRSVPALESAVVSVASFHTSTDATNIIPQTVQIKGTVRTFDAGVQDLIEAQMKRIVEHTANAHDAKAVLTYERGVPITRNSEAETSFAADAAAEVVDERRVNRNALPELGNEDFSFMLNARPGAFIYIGNGDSASVHHPKFDFNDEAIPFGCSYWTRLVERAMPAV
ncbi:M20 family metallopeptidase [Bradyrhizobium sp. CCGUVB4N]|uniref:M20 aminoacylase family protein n=1 Tax=Bradyrhizobium sp. CCGUVB4N TaxID=2949631 RepID=UPI0020B3F3DC|nr:M20 aminoacylase family protein [Bradyrhizobium sp. CCGUVB4N]MCP3380324.1 M20 family metallopeptidase [Bradyrhizobium sp. CCGUVB4N]